MGRKYISVNGRGRTTARPETCSFLSCVMISRSPGRSLGSWRHSYSFTLSPSFPPSSLLYVYPSPPGRVAAWFPNPILLLGPPTCLTPPLPPALTPHSRPHDSNTTWLSSCYASGPGRKTPVPAAPMGLSRGLHAPAASLHGPGFCDGHTWLLSPRRTWVEPGVRHTPDLCRSKERP